MARETRVINANARDETEDESESSSMRDFIASESDSEAAHSSDSSFKPPERPSRPSQAGTDAVREGSLESLTNDIDGTSKSDATSTDGEDASDDSNGTADVVEPNAFVWRTPSPPSVPRPVPLLPPPLPTRYPKRERRAPTDVYLAANARRVRRVLEADELRDQVREVADWRGAPISADNMELLVRVAGSTVRSTHARVALDVGPPDIEITSQQDDTDADAEEDSEEEGEVSDDMTPIRPMVEADADVLDSQ
jgi:hypothetical protein